MRQNKCFALLECECVALTSKRCLGKCAFYKTVEQHKAELETAFARIAALPFPLQRYIADQHYSGRYPWIPRPPRKGRFPASTYHLQEDSR